MNCFVVRLLCAKLKRTWKRSISSRFNLLVLATTAACFCLLLITCNLDRLGAKYADEGNYASAIRCYEAMIGVERALGTKSIRLADALTDLGLCYEKTERTKEAFDVERMAVEMRREVLSDEVAQLMN